MLAPGQTLCAQKDGRIMSYIQVQSVTNHQGDQLPITKVTSYQSPR